MRNDYYTNSKDYINRWVISYADFVTMLLALFIVMYAVLRVDNAKLTEFNEKIKETYCMVRALCYIDPKYVSYCLTKLDERHTEPEIKEFINYYKKTYAFDNSAILRSNYYGRNKHRTNNISEGNNNKLNHLFNKKPSTIRLLFELRFEESYFKSLFDKINEG